MRRPSPLYGEGNREKLREAIFSTARSTSIAQSRRVGGGTGTMSTMPQAHQKQYSTSSQCGFIRPPFAAEKEKRHGG